MARVFLAGENCARDQFDQTQDLPYFSPHGEVPSFDSLPSNMPQQRIVNCHGERAPDSLLSAQILVLSSSHERIQIVNNLCSYLSNLNRASRDNEAVWYSAIGLALFFHITLGIESLLPLFTSPAH